MKKFLFSTMIASLLAFVGCQNEELVSENTNNGGEKVILTANIQGATDSRVVLPPATDNEGKPIVKVKWNESGEKFKVYGYNSSRSDYYGTPTWFTQIEDTNQFEGTLPSTDNGTYLAVYGDDEVSKNTPLQYFLAEQDGTLTDCLSIPIGNETFYLHYVLMRDTIADLSSPIEFEHETAILKPTFKVGGTDIDNTITQIVMGNVIYPTTTNAGITEITIIPHLVEQIQSASGTTFTLDDDIYIHLPMAYIPDGQYSPNHKFTFTVTAGGKEYTGSLTIPTGMSIVAGKLYTATIALTEVPTYCHLPEPDTFRDAIFEVLDDNSQLTKIEFKANSNVTLGTPIGTCGAYLVANGETLEIHTSKSVFVFPGNCASMFNGLEGVTSIKFNDCIDTSNVTSMNNMFRSLSALKELDLSCFDTSNVTDMRLMFAYCSKLEMLNLSSFNVDKVTNFEDMLWIMSKLENGEKTQVYVPNPNPFVDKNTGINTDINSQPVTPEYAEYVIGTPQ